MPSPPHPRSAHRAPDRLPAPREARAQPPSAAAPCPRSAGPSPLPTFEFHVSRAARDRYGFAQTLFSLTGNVVLADFAASREFAARMNRVRDAARFPERTVHPAALNAMGLIDESLHALVARYREQLDPGVMLDALDWFAARLGAHRLEATLQAFASEFPTVAVYGGAQTPAGWLAGQTGATPHRAVALEEMLLLWLANANPAFAPFSELFADRTLAHASAYTTMVGLWRDYFATRPGFGPGRQNLVDLLRAPALASPTSLSGQLAYLREQWGELLGPVLRRMLAALGALQEEEIALWRLFHLPGAPRGDSSAAAVPRFDGADAECARFSSDVDWMPRTVLVAKSAYVWLDQLSTAYGRPIRHLNEVPDAELDRLARYGFTALWLIGLWERSRASQRIKQLCGNPDAVASAYSISEYSIAADLGGDAACADLRRRAAARGIRLASDMVTNHMGLDSPWVIHHPDWFLSLPHSPFPAYRFEGPDLSSDERVEIKIEDRYYDRGDAAVVFRRRDRWTGDVRYIYHGNDGTSYPWNDSAQLDYLKAEVRENVIQTILHVARMFPLIRFDAAMTLAKRHYQRLWFPEPESTGAIPSRAEYGMSKAAFDAAMPQEFWREVVDRVAAEVPGTLLLAEAFWLMEGYFVRTLGMHRVYNSAFMNMLRDEENANYRSVIKRTLEFDPEILKRYVNFMNNPDERTAVDQFGKGDKYFGICTLMATLPGLPMFGHGQFEGLAEKYGMDFRRPRLAERPDPWVEARHEREIAPLLRRRALFAEVRDFLLYDFFTAGGAVNEDVFAYSNRRDGDRALIVVHNRFARTQGWVRTSCAVAEKTPDGGKRLCQHTLGESFGLTREAAHLVAFRDARSGLEYLHRAAALAENGLALTLEAYECRVLLDWRDWRDDGARPWARLVEQLAGRGVPSLEEALRAIELQPVHEAWRELIAAPLVSDLADCAAAVSQSRATARAASRLLARGVDRVQALFAAARAFTGSAAGREAGFVPGDAWLGDPDAALRLFRRRLRAALRLPGLEARSASPWGEAARAVLPSAGNTPHANLPLWTSVLAWCALAALGEAYAPAAPHAAAVRLFDDLRLRQPLAAALAGVDLPDGAPEGGTNRGTDGGPAADHEARWRAAARVRAAFAHPLPALPPAARRRAAFPFAAWLEDPDLAWLIGVHQHEGQGYFVQEPYERLLWWLALPWLLSVAASPRLSRPRLAAIERQIASLMLRARDHGYRIEALLPPNP